MRYILRRNKMAIGIVKTTAAGTQRYRNVGAVGAINGTDTSATGVFGTPQAWTQSSGRQVGHSVIFYLITTGVDLRNDDDGDNKAFEAVLRALPTTPLSYNTTGTTNTLIHVIMDATNAQSAAALQTAVQALGTVNSLDLSGATVTLGTSFVVS
jgi:hypothetical protein